jgi:cell division septum initiation protein DivIVA
MASNEPDELETAPAPLPTARKGYDRAATDELVGKLRSSLAAALSQRNQAQARVDELEQRLTDNREREQEITDALVVASRVRAESEREAEEIRARARVEADGIVEDARSRTRGFEREAREAEELAERARAKLTAFLQGLLARVGPQGSGLDSPADDLLSRASEAADGAGREGSADQRDRSTEATDDRLG